MIDFLKYRWLCIGTSMAIIGAFAVGYVFKEMRDGFGTGFEYSIDFTGGTQVMFRLAKPISSSQIQGVLGKGRLAKSNHS